MSNCLNPVLACVVTFRGDLVQEGIFATMKSLQVQTVPAEMSMNPDMTGSRNDLKA